MGGELPVPTMCPASSSPPPLGARLMEKAKGLRQGEN